MSVQVVKTASEGQPIYYKEFMISSEDDVSSLPTSAGEVSPGSQAYTQDLEHTYLLGNDYVWREV